MKKISILLIVLVLTGCTATYEIDIENNNIDEKLTLLESDVTKFDIKNDNGWTMRESFNSLIDNDEFSKNDYKIKSLNSNNQLGVKVDSSLLLQNIKSSSIINQCFNNLETTSTDESIIINTGTFECFNYYEYLDSIKIRLKTNHEVLMSNADEIENNVYIWNINKGEDKSINISLSKINIKKKSNIFIYFIVAIISILLGVFIYLLYCNNKKQNKV